MADYRWVGSKELDREAERWEFTDRISVVLPFTGPHSKCLTERPNRGATVPGYADGLRVVSSVVTELEGSAGRLEVRLEAPIDESSTSTEAIGEASFEVDFTEVNLKLETHPKCGTLSAEACEAGVTWDDWEEIQAHPDYYVDPAGSGWSHVDYLGMKKKGIEEYRVYVPTVSRTTYHFAKPNDVGEGCNQRQNPPIGSFDFIEDYEWLGGADRFTKQGRVYQRTTEWQGADSLDTTLYPE